MASKSPTFSRGELLVIVAAGMSMLIVQMDWFALNLALPVIADDFGVAPTDLQWVISGYMLAIGALMVTAGRLADLYGRRRVIVLGLIVFGVLSAVCGAALSREWLIAARVVQGAGAALVFPVAIAVVASTFGEDRQAHAIGIVLGCSAIGTLAAGVALLVAFVVAEKRIRSPLVDLRLFRNRPFVAVLVAGSISNVVFCFVAVFSALYLQEGRGLSPLDAGLIFLALSVGAAAASYYGGRLAERFEAARVMAVGMLISAAGITALSLVDSLWVYTPVFALCGVGLGLGWALANVATQAVVPPAQIGVASGVTLTSLVMLGAVGVAIGAAVLDLVAGSPEAAGRDEPAIDAVLRVAAGLALVGAALLATLVRGRPGTAPKPAQASASA